MEVRSVHVQTIKDLGRQERTPTQETVQTWLMDTPVDMDLLHMDYNNNCTISLIIVLIKV